MSGMSWNSAPSYKPVNTYFGSPDICMPSSKPEFGFNMPPMTKNAPAMDCGVNFKPECNESVAHVLRGLNAAVSLLLDERRPNCRPNDCSPKQDSWCFPQLEYVPVSLPNDCWQPEPSWNAPLPDWKFDDYTVTQVQQMGRRFSDFLCN